MADEDDQNPWMLQYCLKYVMKPVRTVTGLPVGTACGLQVTQHRVLQGEVIVEAGQIVVHITGQVQVRVQGEASLHGQNVGGQGERDVPQEVRHGWVHVGGRRFRGSRCHGGHRRGRPLGFNHGRRHGRILVRILGTILGRIQGRILGRRQNHRGLLNPILCCLL